MKAFNSRLLHSLILICLLTSLSLSTSGAKAMGTILYVDQSATGADNGKSWTDAYVDLQSALAIAVSGYEIWVAEGIYKPTTGTDRAVTFQLASGVALYGGFAGTETDLDQRDPDPATNGTILSGDIGTGGDNSDNSYHVVTGNGTNNTAVLDGFTVTGGNANASTYPHFVGGGMYIQIGSPTLANVTFSSNSASGSGGGLINGYGSPTLINVTFSGNSATWGGAMYDTSGNPTFTNVTFNNNTAAQLGGGIYSNSQGSPTFIDVTFSGNSADWGGGMFELGGSPTLTNVTFSGNSASSWGGGLVNGYSSPTLTNVTFSANSATLSGGAIYNYGESTPKVRNTILWGNSAPMGSQVFNDDSSAPVIRYSVVKGGCPAGSTCSNLITTNPRLGTLGDYGSSISFIPLQTGSSAIDAGSDTYCPATDQRGAPRPHGSHCDIGAYEYTPATRYVKWDATGANDGSSWTDAYPDLQSALAVALSGDEIWVAAGTYQPTPGADRTATFQLKSGVALYGGFAGIETERDRRDPDVNDTLLSGDIGTEGNNSDNSYHVVTGSGTDNTAILDGFTIAGGNANGDDVFSGGGMYNNGGSPTLINVTFSSNSASLGGGMFNSSSSSPTLTDVTFDGNSATGFGGGMYNTESSNPTLMNVTFHSNSVPYDGSGSGGGIYNSASSPTLINVTFSSNSASYGGGMVNFDISSPILTNVTFSGNTAAWGGGMYNIAGSPTLANVTFRGNSAAGSGGGISNVTNSAAKIRNTILWGNSAPDGAQVFNDTSTPVIRYSVVEGGCPIGSSCAYLVTTDPSLGTLDDYGGSTLTIPLQVGSSAINTGNDTWCPATDQRGATRPKGLHCDIGAFEFTVAAPALAAPTDDEILLHKRPTFDWSDIPDATRYKIQASRSSTFDILEINVNATDLTYTPATDLSANKEYFWRVKAQANGVWSAWSTTWSFTTGKPSSIPVLTSPADGTMFKNNYKPALDWNNSTVPAGKTFDHYQIQVANDLEFSSLALDEVTDPGAVTDSLWQGTEWADALPANDTYYWRVRAFNTDGHYSSWSTIWSFTLALQPPDIVSPADGTGSIPRQPTLDWSDVSGATGYKLVVSKYPDFSTPLLSVNVTESIFNDTDWTFDLPANKLIYWRVKALGDNPSAWTSGSFTTGP